MSSLQRSEIAIKSSESNFHQLRASDLVIYRIPVQSQFLNVTFTALEFFQRSFTRNIHGLSKLLYADSLNDLRAMSQANRILHRH